jgi:hypothetical protein
MSGLAESGHGWAIYEYIHAPAICLRHPLTPGRCVVMGPASENLHIRIAMRGYSLKLWAHVAACLRRRTSRQHLRLVHALDFTRPPRAQRNTSAAAKGRGESMTAPTISAERSWPRPLRRPVLIVSTTLTIALFAAIYIGFFAR